MPMDELTFYGIGAAALSLIAAGLSLVGRASMTRRERATLAGQTLCAVFASVFPDPFGALLAYGLAGVLGSAHVAGRSRGARVAWEYGALVLAGFGLALVGRFAAASGSEAVAHDVLLRLAVVCGVAGLAMMAGLAPVGGALDRARTVMAPASGRCFEIAARLPVLIILARFQSAGEPMLWRIVLVGFGAVALWCDAMQRQGSAQGIGSAVAFDLAFVALGFGHQGEWIAACLGGVFGVGVLLAGVADPMVGVGRVFALACLPPMPSFAALVGLTVLLAQWSIWALAVVAGAMCVALARVRMPGRSSTISVSAGPERAVGRLALMALSGCGLWLLWRMGGGV